ncbi:MAG TPA: nucleotidyltransferase family protein [Gemmatimonadaceae bacterium]|nr:nucleotidyltransferase family protein [Gemmatimonadaceae bacterium]
MGAKPPIGVVILAAGGSSRLGTPKQLLNIGGDTLLGRAARTALASGVDRVVVVLGAHADACRQALAGLPLDLVVHPQWAEGQASSIHAGLTRLQAIAPAAAIIMLCDQPRISPPVIAALIDRYRVTGARVVSSRYASAALGPPALFDKSVFDDLLALTGDAGAKRIIAANLAEAISFPDGDVDIDTEADLAKLPDIGPADFTPPPPGHRRVE